MYLDFWFGLNRSTENIFFLLSRSNSAINLFIMKLEFKWQSKWQLILWFFLALVFVFLQLAHSQVFDILEFFVLLVRISVLGHINEKKKSLHLYNAWFFNVDHLNYVTCFQIAFSVSLEAKYKVTSTLKLIYLCHHFLPFAFL